MKLKYYMRGIGIGIIVTVCVFSVTQKTEKLTDAQIKMRALELGMVEETVLADLKEETAEKDAGVEDNIIENKDVTENDSTADHAETEESAETPEEAVNSEEAVKMEGTANTEAAVKAEEREENEAEGSLEDKKDPATENEAAASGTKTDEAAQTEVMESYIVIAVEKGNGSESVSQKLFEAGLINSAKDYNRFLVENGYDRRLSIGNHEIPVNATEEEMAKILCGMK